MSMEIGPKRAYLVKFSHHILEYFCNPGITDAAKPTEEKMTKINNAKIRMSNIIAMTKRDIERRNITIIAIKY